MDDFTLTFDPKSFLAGIDDITKSLDDLRSRFAKTANDADKQTKQGLDKTKKNEKEKADAHKSSANMITEGMSGLLKKAAALGAAYLSIRYAMSKLPEIGQTFSIAGDIISRNFLWPLRKELIPYLQKILDWVRDHRAMFVRWGSVLADVFRAVVGVIKVLLKNIQTMFSAFTKTWEGFFGKSKKSLLEWIQVFIFKITTIMIAIQVLLAPVFEFLGKVIGKIAIATKAYFDGLVEGLSHGSGLLNDFIALMKEVASIFDEVNAESGDLYKAFKIIGDAIGTGLVISLRAVVTALRIIVDLIKMVIANFRVMGKIATGDFSGALSMIKKQGSIASSIGGHIKGFASSQVDSVKGFVGRAVDTVSGPSVKATGKASGAVVNSNMNSTIKIEKIEVGLKDKDEAEKVGKQVGSGVRKQVTNDIKTQLRKDREALAVTP